MSWPELTIDQIKAPGDRSIAIGPFGSRMKSDRYVAQGVPVIRGNNLSGGRSFVGDFVYVSESTADELWSSNVFADDLVFPHRGAIGEVGIVPRDSSDRYIMSTSLMKLTCDRDIVEPLFVYYFFKSTRGREALLQHASIVGTPGIGQPLTSLRSIAIPVPPLEEQRSIVSLLSSLDDKIELNRRMSQTLEEIARALFKSWFVDFDPVHAKAAGRQPVGMDAETAALFPSEFEESELGLIPKGWGAARISQFAALNPESWNARSYPASIFYVDLTNAKWGRIESVAEFPGESAPSRAQRILRPGDTIVGTVRPGNGSFAFVSTEGLTGSTGFAVLRPLKLNYQSFVYFAATSTESIVSLSHLADGAAYPAVRPDIVAALPVIAPSDEVICAFDRLIGGAIQHISENQKESLTLANIRDLLLPRLLSGDLRITSKNP